LHRLLRPTNSLLATPSVESAQGGCFFWRESLGDELIDDQDNLPQELVEDRLGLDFDTDVYDHDDGHLGLSPSLPVVEEVLQQ
jgi:hypothetical protein